MNQIPVVFLFFVFCQLKLHVLFLNNSKIYCLVNPALPLTPTEPRLGHIAGRTAANKVVNHSDIPKHTHRSGLFFLEVLLFLQQSKGIPISLALVYCSFHPIVLTAPTPGGASQAAVGWRWTETLGEEIIKPCKEVLYKS